MKKRHSVQRNIWVVAVLGVLLFIMGFPVSLPAASVNINLVIVNPSENESRETPIKFNLPRELKAEDIVNTNGLEVDYDVEQKTYYVHGQVNLQPKESRSIKIEVKDRWYIAQEEIDVIKNQIESNVKMLEGEEYHESAVLIKEVMLKKLDQITEMQKNYSDNVERRIEEYRAHRQQFEEIRNNAFSLDYFKKVQSIPQESARMKFVIEVKNPSDKEVRKVKQQHYLPIEVKADDVVEPQGFEVRFDDEKQQFFLQKEEEFKPGETKRYEVFIRDIWRVDPNLTGNFRNQTEKAIDEVKDSEFAKNAQFLADRIIKKVEEIEASQKDKQNMKEYIGAARANWQRITEAQDDLDKLQKLLIMVKSKKLEQLEKSKVKNVLQKISALRGISEIASTLFNKKPSLTMVWKMIIGTLIFVALLTSFHFFTWWQRSKTMGEVSPNTVIKEVKLPEATVEEKGEKK